MQYLPILAICAGTSIFLYFILFLLILASVFVIFKFGRLYVKALAADAPVSFAQIIGMSFRCVDAKAIIEHRIMAKKSGVDIASSTLEAHCLAGGNLGNVVRAIIAASKANIEFSFDNACAIDLSGRDVFDAVKTSINPKVFDCRGSAKDADTLEAITKDGIQLKVKACVTLRTKVDKLIGGATEDTVVARVSEGIVTAIGSFDNYKKVIEMPDMVTRIVLEKGLDADTAFKILSINIIDVGVGENIGAKILAEQAEADKRVAQAEAEKRQSAALIRAQEMKVLTEENNAKLLAAEAEVSKAVAQAFREGNLGVMDYYHMKNIKADADMKVSISKSESQPTLVK